MTKTYILRTCDAKGCSRGGFQWPKSGRVEAPDWKHTRKCGNGLHGLRMGEGDGSLLNWSPDAVWIVAEVDADVIIDLDGKVKFPACVVVFCGDRAGALSLLAERGGDMSRMVGGTATAGDYGTATAGYRGTAIAGDYGTAIAENDGTATAGDYGTATAGYYGTATAGDYGTAIAENDGTATAGDYGTATAGDYGTATAGHRGTAIAGYRGTIIIKWLGGARYRFAVGYVGEDGIKANTAYRVQNGKLVQADNPLASSSAADIG